MQVDPDGEYPEEPSSAGWKNRLHQAAPALLLAAVIVLAAVAITEPWEEPESGLGVVAQVRSRSDSAEDLETGPEAGKLAPNFRLESLSGEVVELADLRGTPVFLNFWATWCLFCVTEMPAMQKVADEYGHAISVLGVNVGESRERATGFVTNNDIHYPIVLDSTVDVTEAYAVRTMPTSLFIDRNGVISEVRYGPVTPDEMAAALMPLVEQQ
jgi:cytochrome c biogenesis protein CcmG, thiol:disulfide interchange protein DsbE